MINEKKVKYRQIGEVIYRKNQRAKNLAIRISMDGVVKVTVPGWCSFHKAELFVQEKASWISKKLHSIERRKEEKLVWEVGEEILLFQGRIKIMNSAGEKIRVDEDENGYNIHLPAFFDPGKEEHREAQLDAVNHVSLFHAKKILPNVINNYSLKNDLPFRRIGVRRMKTRWGSCSSQDNISLNSALVFLPEDLIEYVCLHELVHTKHKNHSKAFWDCLCGYLPDALERRKQLRRHHIF